MDRRRILTYPTDSKSEANGLGSACNTEVGQSVLGRQYRVVLLEVCFWMQFSDYRKDLLLVVDRRRRLSHPLLNLLYNSLEVARTADCVCSTN